MATNNTIPPSTCGAFEPAPAPALASASGSSHPITPSATSSAGSTFEAAAQPERPHHTPNWNMDPPTQGPLLNRLDNPHIPKPGHPKLTASALKEHDERCERHSVRQAIRYGQRSVPTSKRRKRKAVKRLEDEFRDAAAETIYGLESALSTMTDQHTRLDNINALLHAQLAELQSRNHVLAQNLTRERAARTHAQSKAVMQERAMQAEVDYLRRVLASEGKEDQRFHCTISPKGKLPTAQTRALPPPAAWHPGADDGVDHGDIYSDTLSNFITHGTMPAAYWTP